MVWKDIFPIMHNGITFILFRHGIWYWVYTAYIYSFFILGLIAIFVRLNLYEDIFKKQAWGVLIGSVIPFSVHLAYQIFFFHILPQDITSSILGVSGLIFLILSEKTRLFDLVPEPPSAVFFNSVNGILVLDSKFRLLSANQSASALLNLNLSNQIGNPISTLFPEFQNIDQQLSGSESGEFVQTYKQQDKILEFRLAPFKDTRKESHGFLMFIRDETERIIAQDEIRINQRKYTELFENILIGAIIFQTQDDGDHFTISGMNRFAQLNMGLYTHTFLGKPMEQYFIEDDYRILVERIPIVLRSGISMHIPIIQTMEYGRVVWREFYLYKFSDTEVITLCKDITEEMLAKKKLTETNQEMERYVKRLEEFSADVMYLNQFGNKLQSCLTCKEVAEQVHHYVGILFPEHKSGLIIYDLINKTIQFSDFKQNELNIFTSLLEFFARELPTHKLIDFTSLVDKENIPFFPPTQNKDQINPCMGYVSPFGEQKLAVLVMDGLKEKLSQKQHQNLDSIGERMILTLSNIELQQRLKYEALHDEQTGFYNRRYLSDRLNSEIHRAERYHHHLAMIMFDVDFFKRFNDTYSHLAGDMVLHQISAEILTLIRKSDLPFRYGGEEFLILLPETDLIEAEDTALRIAQRVRELTLTWNGETLDHLTISGGVCVFPEHAKSSEELILKADQALYVAKENGRDQICVYQPSSLQ